MKILYTVESSWDAYSDSCSLCAFENEEMAEEYIKKSRIKYFEDYGEEDTDLMWVSEINLMESVEEALEVIK